MATPEPTVVHVGTRRSALALKQAETIVGQLQKVHPQLKFEIHAISVAGDRDKSTPLPDLGKGLWTTELDAKLATRELDVIVHCLKDMATTSPPGCIIGAVTEREDPRDVVIFRQADKYSKLADLPDGSVVGTSSVRRAAQLKRHYPTLKFKDVRGNIDTRLRKLASDGFDCIILAAAGLLRMGWGDKIGQYLDSDTENGGMLHAVGQGALALEIRKGDEHVHKLLQSIGHNPTMLATFAERSIMRTLEGGCSVPIGVETRWADASAPKTLHLKAVVTSPDGSEEVQAEDSADILSVEDADAFGQKVAQALADKGAQKILDAINKGRDGEHGAVKVADI